MERSLASGWTGTVFFVGAQQERVTYPKYPISSTCTDVHTGRRGNTSQHEAKSVHRTYVVPRAHLCITPPPTSSPLQRYCPTHYLACTYIHTWLSMGRCLHLLLPAGHVAIAGTSVAGPGVSFWAWEIDHTSRPAADRRSGKHDIRMMGARGWVMDG